MIESFAIVPPAKEMIVFLKQHIGTEPKPLVKNGDKVKFGQKIADYDTSNPMSVPIHSPVNGEILEIKSVFHPQTRKEELAIIIKTQNDEISPVYKPLSSEELTKDIILERIREAGIVGLGGAAFPTYVKLAQESKIKHLIINAKESDPNITADICLINEKPKELIEGIKILEKLLNPQEIIFATRVTHSEIPEFETLAKEHGIIVKHIPPNYSLGSEKLLIKKLLNKEIPAGKYPVDIGAVVHNVATIFAIRSALCDGTPLVSRGLTLYTEKTRGKNLWVRMGTPVEHILEFVGIDPHEFDRIILGSIFMGTTIPQAFLPILKATSGITLFGKDYPDPYQNEKPCIRCSYCNIICPVDIYPQLIMESEKKENVKMLKKLHVEVCIECGLCSYVCPSRINLTRYLTQGKRLIYEK